MKEEEIRKLEEEKEYILKWLANLGLAQELAPDVQRKLEQIEWQISALKNSPDEADEISTPNLKIEIDRDYQILPFALPEMPRYEITVFSSSDTFSSSGSSSVYEFVTRVGDLKTPDALNYSEAYTASYTNLEASKNRVNDIRNQLSVLGNQQTLDRFEEAHRDFYKYKGGVGDKKSAALSMRNFIDGIKGDLFRKARTHKNENMTWGIMSKRLAKSSLGGHEEEL